MRMLKLYDGDYPWDVRVDKMLRSLVGAKASSRTVARPQFDRPSAQRENTTTLHSSDS